MRALTVQEVEDALASDPRHRLDDALVEQSEIAAAINRAQAEAKESLDLLRLDLDVLDRTIADRVRRADAAAKKPTATEVTDAVRGDPERQALARRVINKEKVHNLWAGLSEAWRRRGYTLRNLSDLWLNDYFDSQAVTVRSGPRSIDRSARQALRAASTSPRTRQRID